MNLKLACADFTFPLLSHEQALRLIAMLGFEGVDIGLFEERSHRWPSREFLDVSRSAGTLRGIASDLGLRVADVFLQMSPDFRPLAINHPDPEPRRKARDWFARALEYAAACDCEHVTVLPGVSFETESRDDSLSRAVDELAWRIEQAGQSQITLGVEAHVGSIVPDPVSASELLSRVAGLTLTLDYTHFTRAGLPDEAIEPLLPFASHIHARGARPGRLQVAFKDNVIDYQRMVSLLAQRD
ncbi:MAG: sugar phosphate isomerase/epimerase family protein, partial [Isosphaeraceae bacterium]